MLPKVAAPRVQAVAKYKIMLIEKADNYREDIIKLLAAEKLPVADLPLTLENFLVALQNKEVIGVAGLEIYEAYGLLRSLAVRTDYRGQGIADKLLQRITDVSILKGLSELYL